MALNSVIIEGVYKNETLVYNSKYETFVFPIFFYSSKIKELCTENKTIRIVGILKEQNNKIGIFAQHIEVLKK